MSEKYYQLGTHTAAQWIELHQELIDDGNLYEAVPVRPVQVDDAKAHSPTRGTYLLTKVEADELKTDPRVKFINIDYSKYDEYTPPKDELQMTRPALVNRYTGNVRSYREFETSNTLPSTPTSAEVNRTGYQITRLQQVSQVDPWLDDSLSDNDVVTQALEMCENRGDCFVIVDPVLYNSGISQVTTEGTKFNSSYGAMYWPWIQVSDDTGMNRWVPGSVGAAEVFAFNDKTKHPWFAPAGLNRGVINAVQAERKLLNSTRDTLYRNRINPIATFPGQGVTIFGQKTLQKKSSALDRVNVRRLLIAVKKFIASSSRFLVFEQNTPSLRKEFLAIANPFLEKVQSKSGLNAFKVVMDNTNNTSDTIDRNQLIGHIFLQPTKTAEFITIDFTIQRSGAEFSE